LQSKWLQRGIHPPYIERYKIYQEECKNRATLEINEKIMRSLVHAQRHHHKSLQTSIQAMQEVFDPAHHHDRAVKEMTGEPEDCGRISKF
jgi:malate synthase